MKGLQFAFVAWTFSWCVRGLVRPSRDIKRHICALTPRNARRQKGHVDDRGYPQKGVDPAGDALEKVPVHHFLPYYDYRHKATHHTNHVESFWKLFKASVRGTHIHVSSRHMQRYLNEFAFRSNHRKMQNAMFDLLISRL